MAKRLVGRQCCWHGRWALILLGCPASFLKGNAQETASIQRIHGVVINAVTNAPIARALVVSGDQRMAELTDSQGKFEFEARSSAKRFQPGEVPRGGHVLQTLSRSNQPVYLLARKPGYRSMERPAVLDLDDAVALESELRLKLTPEGIVAGLVTAARTETPAGVIVQLMQKQVLDGYGRWRAMQVTQTDSHGEYRFADLPAGQYKVITREWTERGTVLPDKGQQMSGYPPVAFQNGTSVASAAEIHVSAGSTVPVNLNLRAVPYYPIEIPVANHVDGNFLNVLVEDGQGGSGFSLGFNQQTHRVEGALPKGLYHLSLISYGEEQMMTALELSVAGPIRGEPISLTPGAVIPVEIREEYTAEGRRTGDAGVTAAVSNGSEKTISSQMLAHSLQPGERSVEVYLQPQSGDASSGAALKIPAPGNASGNEGLVIEHVRPGAYRVKVMPHHGYASEVTAGGVNLLHQLLVVSAGGGSPTIEITLRDDTGMLSGTTSPAVVDPDASLYGGSTIVWCFPAEGDSLGQPVQSFSTPEGSFVTPGMAPGRYIVLATRSSMQNLEYRNEAIMKQLVSKGTSVTLAPGQKANVTLPLLSIEQE